MVPPLYSIYFRGFWTALPVLLSPEQNICKLRAGRLTHARLRVAYGFMRPLLLHFEEPSPAISDSPSEETGRRPQEVITRSRLIFAGTSTFTEIKSEGLDSDPDDQNRGGKAIPV